METNKFPTPLSLFLTMSPAFSFTNFALSAAFLQLVTAVTNPVVTIQSGTLMGGSSEYVSGVNVFKGIPFGGAVSGSARWSKFITKQLK